MRKPGGRTARATAAALPAGALLIAAGLLLVAVATADRSRPRIGSYPPLGACKVFPDPPTGTPANAESLATQAAWNQDISQAPALSNSSDVIAYIDAHGGDMLHPDFGSPRAYGFPYSVVGRKARKVKVKFTAYGDESSHGVYRVPLKAPVEGGAHSDGDRHVLTFDRRRCLLDELYRAFPRPKRRRWLADSGVIWNLRSSAIRHEGFTSADAAGLPVFPGLVRYDEVASGRIDHAIRVTFDSTRDAWIRPAVHCAGDTSSGNAPPMGMRLRLNAGFSLAGFSGQARVIATALKHYGFIVADNGSNWYFSGTSDTRWNDDNLNQLKSIPGDQFQVLASAAPTHVC